MIYLQNFSYIMFDVWCGKTSHLFTSFFKKHLLFFPPIVFSSIYPILPMYVTTVFIYIKQKIAECV
ncbi:hypothetical protein AN963_23435 [Brevibacillus choshinensis]|uniref:Uncharacterized protein n=1 Tax=Brevibacillus choshinensis TaxID=54911 RepID=A0ABR5N1I0_BRECH|nr:hypothetical protein AN963_23435 [Brevibacillus choshinensis]